MIAQFALHAATVFAAVLRDAATARAVVVRAPWRGAARRRTGRDLALPAFAESRRPRTGSAGSRLLGAVLALALLATLTGGGAGPRPPAPPPYDTDCSAWTARGRPFADTPPEYREHAFLCLVRDRPGPMFPAGRTDQELLAYGRELCAKPRWERIEEWLRSDDWAINMRRLDDALLFLCPDTIGLPGLMPSAEQMAEDHAAYVSASNAVCSDPWPRLRARRQGTAAYFTPEAGGYHIGDDRDPAYEDGVTPDLDGLLTTAKTAVGIDPIGEKNICLTVKAFAKAPPLRLRGWDEVAEVRVTTRSGRLTVPAMPPDGEEGAGRPLPNLAINGPGHYRVRVYARAGEDDTTILPTEQHLIVVYPGQSRKKIVYRSRR